jgi:uncharacterized protein with PIN domain
MCNVGVVFRAEPVFRHNMVPADSLPPTPPKATLFCQSCGHQAHVDSDWQSVRTGTETRYRCPDCSTVVTTRPRRSSDDSVPDTEAILVTYLETVSESTRLWQRFWKQATTAN